MEGEGLKFPATMLAWSLCSNKRNYLPMFYMYMYIIIIDAKSVPRSFGGQSNEKKKKEDDFFCRKMLVLSEFAGGDYSYEEGKNHLRHTL